MIIANFTPDEIMYTHGGLSSTIKSGDIVDLEESKAKFILNKFDKKGLIRLDFGDDPNKKREEAMETWQRFWRRQITMYNQDNERRKNTQREYAEPTPEIVAHAEKLGIELLGPWTLKQTDNAAIQAVLNENTLLKSQITQLSSQIAALAEAMSAREVPFELRSPAEKIEITKRGAESQPVPTEETAPRMDHRELITEFQMLNREKFGEWVTSNLERIASKDYPPAVRSMVKDKWERLIKGAFPGE
jgi:hypothetical protein